MNWNDLKDIQQIAELKANSYQRPQLIFKHSTRCSISQMALSRFERSWSDSEIECYFLDLLKFRAISNFIETEFEVEHQSPQVLLIKNGQCVYHESHNAIFVDEVLEAANQSQ